MNKLIGHQSTLKNLIELHQKNNIPNKILISGPKGIGKSSLVDHFLKYVYSNEILVNQNLHPNIYKIFKKDEKKNIEISQIREMIKFLNLSSFNDIQKTVVIDHIELLNVNSANALLKSLEEPNDKDMFILINNSNISILETLRSRCVEFKVSLNAEEVIKIINNSFDDQIYEKISDDFKNIYTSPSFMISLINFFKENDININDITIENFLSDLITKKLYIKNNFIKNNLDFFIELFFYKNIRLTKKISFKLKDYFYLKLHNIKHYNLDIDSFFMEFEEKLLSE